MEDSGSEGSVPRVPFLVEEGQEGGYPGPTRPTLEPEDGRTPNGGPTGEEGGTVVLPVTSGIEGRPRVHVPHSEVTPRPSPSPLPHPPVRTRTPRNPRSGPGSRIS